MIVLAWLWFVVVQIISLTATILGWFILIPFCLTSAWSERAVMSINPEVKDSLSVWSWHPLNWIYGNPEDGVSGREALVWNKEGTAKERYMPNAWAPWRAYVWSAWRNSADNLKYVFAWENGPFVQIGRHKLGWQWENGYKVPVLS